MRLGQVQGVLDNLYLDIYEHTSLWGSVSWSPVYSFNSLARCSALKPLAFGRVLCTRVCILEAENENYVWPAVKRTPTNLMNISHGNYATNYSIHIEKETSEELEVGRESTIRPRTLQDEYD